MNTIITLFALGIVIFIHELGHLLAAKRAGIGVYEFAIGMGPKVFGKEVNGTLYSLRAFPFGGFVKLAGMDDENEEKIAPELSYKNKSIFDRGLTIAAGAIMNILLGLTIFILIFSIMGVPIPSSQVQAIFPDSPAAEVGLKVGDKITQINGASITDITQDLIPKIQSATGTSITLTINRAGASQTLSITPIESTQSPGTGVIGVQFASKSTRFNPIKAMGLGVLETVSTIKQVFFSLSILIRGEANMGDLAGPVGIIQVASFQLDRGILSFLSWMAVISISLGVVNLFPFPVLDGGHLVFLIVEAIRKKPLKPIIEERINKAGAILLISLMVIIIFNDIVNWKDRVELLKALSGG